jgi:hypothetical protein
VTNSSLFGKLVQGLHADGGGGIKGKDLDLVQSSFVR